MPRVKERLGLASVSYKLLRLYREGAMTLDQVMAFTGADDHMRKEDARGN